MKAIEYLESLNKFGIKPGLERMELLLDYLGNPEEKLNIIHVGGTNGKGSTAAILTSIYKEAGYKVGTYNSPHLIEFNERIRINDENISDQDLKKLVNKLKIAIKKVNYKLEHPTFFEVITALAISYFADQKVDLAILEVGMGGRLDATNVVDTLISIITNVSLDHTDYLGNTISEIAVEKAGIIKPDQFVITATQNKEVLSCLKQVCSEKEARLVNVYNKFSWKKYQVRLLKQVFDIRGEQEVYNKLQLPLLGNHQIVNAATALSAIEILNDQFPVTKVEIKQGISKVNWPGRLEVTSTQPTIILDGAHNYAAAKKLKEAIRNLEYDNLFLVVSILADKDVKGIISQLAPSARQVIIAENINERVEEVTNIKEEVIQYNSNVKLEEELVKAIDYTKQVAEVNDLIVISGSLYTVAEAKDILEN
ncbi:folylpolyglutamate synthase/dihydrofolate synthase [Halobacteroides halobius DSM 5150]|uniref:Dihydrofolate synthase/folylpolyglutamate synthase n=1 Tax=Halobacteroides halobius (strain ATCC 35273 / DSM 5150 / MD-1) TaxID=748449 RepID=L0K9F6_HALHC|nr:folylpolyglutamate synthase/dihydrofolate synthase family protein [Halobacteroides halobius]AGB41917.1 folylpolyglutamate synthase/dihydrofolate synthase [Halobacteroides halobius DSM 5150]